MPTITKSPRVHKSYPLVDPEGTLIDYRDDPTAWAREPRYRRQTTPNALDVLATVEQPWAFLSNGG